MKQWQCPSRVSLGGKRKRQSTPVSHFYKHTQRYSRSRQSMLFCTHCRTVVITLEIAESLFNPHFSPHSIFSQREKIRLNASFRAFSLWRRCCWNDDRQGKGSRCLTFQTGAQNVVSSRHLLYPILPSRTKAYEAFLRRIMELSINGTVGFRRQQLARLLVQVPVQTLVL